MPVKLLYFNARGAMEVTRYILHIGGEDWEDFRYSNREEADAGKAAGKHDLNLGRVPILEVDGKGIAQSKTIERFVAKKYGMMGADDIEAGQIDMVQEHIRDIKDAYQKVRGIADEAAKKEAMDKFFATDLPDWFGKLEKALKITSASPTFAVGSKLSLADIVIYYNLSFFWDNVQGVKAAYTNFPLLSSIVSATASHAKVVEWEAKRPQTAL